MGREKKKENRVSQSPPTSLITDQDNKKNIIIRPQTGIRIPSSITTHNIREQMREIRNKNKKFDPRMLMNIPQVNRVCEICGGRSGEKGVKKIKWDHLDSCFKCADCKKRFSSDTLKGS